MQTLPQQGDRETEGQFSVITPPVPHNDVSVHGQHETSADNIKVTGDTATADITSTWQNKGAQSETKTEPNAYVKEDGKWLDCQQPS